MAILQLIHAGALQQPVLNLSPWLEDRRDLYQDHLLVVSCTGDFNPWVRFFCEAVEAQSTDQLLRIQRLSALRQQLVDRVRAADIRGLAVNITEELVGYPFITPSAAATIHGKSYPAANTAIQKLVSLDILRERTGRNYNRIYSCDEVLRVIDS